MTTFQHFYDLFVPTHYTVYLDINRAEKVFSGKTTIEGNAKTTRIGIHQKDLLIASVQADGNDVPFSIDAAIDAIWIDLPKAGDTELVITYSAKLTDTMMGIYPSYYEVDGVKKQLIGTQFETNSARQAFPGVDEPEAKATFDIAIKYDEHPGEIILANMPEKNVLNGVHCFETTVKMSTYLVAFGFGELQGKTTETKSGVKVGVFGTLTHEPKELDFALDIAKRSIEFYEDFFNTPYPLPHSWQLGLPDFSAGAMENWGLITYREAYVLIDADKARLGVKRRVATVIAHEVAHQWFGDLVTMKWWDDLWLNESFANMMEYVCTDALEPDLQIWEEFQTSDAAAALQRDATDGVQSVHVTVEDPAEVDALFDPAIVYAKGARMLVMVRALIGDDALRSGLKNYFDKHSYGNATGADLWSALSDASGIDVGAVMHSWLEQPGYPVVSATLENGDLVLAQKQFFIGEGKEVGRTWQIPLNSNYAVAPELMKETTLNLGNYAELRKTTGQPFRLNVGNNSHFIVNYTQELLDDILVDADQLDAISQLQLLQDLRLLAEGRVISFATIVPLLTRFASSTYAVVNQALYTIAKKLKVFVTADSAEEVALKKLFNQLSADQYARLGLVPVAGESNDDQISREKVVDAAMYAENPTVIADAHKLFSDYAGKLAQLPASTRFLVLINEVKNFGTQQLADQLLSDYTTSPDANYKEDICVALTKTHDKAVIAQLVGQFENADTIKPQDLRGWFFQTLANPKGEQAAWDWIRNDWQWLLDTVGGDMSFTSYVKLISNVFDSPERLAEYHAFFDPKLNTLGLTREITMGINVIETRIALIAADKEAVNVAVSAAVK